MTHSETAASQASTHQTERSTSSEVVRALDDLCASLGPGSRIPTHTKLMRLFQASERAVRTALDELQREGRIVRKNGVGTFVAEALPSLPMSKPNPTLVVVTRPDHAFFDRCMDLLFRHCEAADLSLVCHPVDAPEIGPVLAASATHHALGFILFGYQLAPLAKQLLEREMRVVVVGAPPADVTPEVPCVYNDHAHGGYLATHHLIEFGHRRIAFVHAGAGDLLRQRRWQGHQRALREARRAGLLIEDRLLSEAETDAWERDPARARTFFQTPQAPTGIIAWNDYEAAKLLKVLIRAGVQVPAEASLVGYDALPEGNLVHPSLTTVEHGVDQQLRMAVELLTQATPPPPSHTVVFVPTLAPRESTAAPALPQTVRS